MRNIISRSIKSAAAGAALALVSGTALAVPIVGTGTGTFSGLSGCSGMGDFCSNGGNQVVWGDTAFLIFPNYQTANSLTANTVNINTQTNANDITIGQLTWFNNIGAAGDANFNVNWTLSLNFTKPSAPDPDGSETFNLSVLNPTNSTTDQMTGFTLTDLTALQNSFSLAGISVSDLHYVVSGNGSLSTANGNTVWYDPDGGTSTLKIVADFSASQPTSVPEPGTLGLAGLALVGLAAVHRKKNRA